MKQEVIVQLHGDFEAHAQRPEDGQEHWFARDLQGLLGYSNWRDFMNVVQKAMISCQTSGQSIHDHFADVPKMVPIGSGTEREVDDVALSRYACYLIAQNGDPSKQQVAFAQTYFAVQTRRFEVMVERMAEIERLSAREKLTVTEKELSGLIAARIKDHQSIGRIRSKGDQALFGGKTTQAMKKKLGVPASRPIADFLQTVIIKGKDFAHEITNTSIKRDGLCTEDDITLEHVKNNGEVRDILKRRGMTPENLPAAEDLEKVKRRLNAEAKKLPKGIPVDPPADTLLPSQEPK